jgi:hydroxymethylpyrimidine pyrophosphatase-like HAD family hydrolase
MPAGIDTGAGVAWLADEPGIALDEMAGVGDADSDLVFLDRVGFAAGPSNATAGVRARADYVADRSFGDGLLEIIERIVAANRRATAA